MPLLNLELLGEILSDLGPDFALSDERRTALCGIINETFAEHEEFCQKRRDATPHKRLTWLQHVERTTKKLQELLHSRAFDIEWEIDRIRGLPRVRAARRLNEIPEESAASSHELAVLMAMFRDPEFPSKQAIEEHNRIKESLSTLVAVAQSGTSYDRKRKDSKRKHDLFRDFLITALARVYEDTFKKNASARREGEWPTFLSRVLSILEGKETTPDAVYEAYLTVKERLIRQRQLLAPEKQRQPPLSSAG